MKQGLALLVLSQHTCEMQLHLGTRYLQKRWILEARTGNNGEISFFCRLASKDSCCLGSDSKNCALWLKITSEQSNFIYSKLFLSFPLQDLLHLSLKEVVLAAIR